MKQNDRGGSEKYWFTELGYWLRDVGWRWLVSIGAAWAALSGPSLGRGQGCGQIPVGVLAGPITNAANGHFYYLLQPSCWTDAEATAVSMGGHLVTENDAAEDTWIENTF